MFDLDGTLVDSSPGVWASIRVAAGSLGLPAPTPEQLGAMLGPPLQEGFGRVLRLGTEKIDRAVAAYREHYQAGAIFDVVVYDGIRELLTSLRASGVTLAVATSKPQPFAVRILEHIGLLAEFDSVHGASLDGTVRHKPQIIGAALAAHPQCRPAVMVGDRSYDVLGASAHRLPCIGAGWGPAPFGELAEAGAAAVAGSPAEVPDALACLPGWRPSR